MAEAGCPAPAVCDDGKLARCDDANASPCAALGNMEPVGIDAYRDLETPCRSICDYEALRATPDLCAEVLDVAALDPLLEQGADRIDATSTGVYLRRVVTSGLDVFEVCGSPAGEDVFLCRRALSGGLQVALLDWMLSKWWSHPHKSNLASQPPPPADVAGQDHREAMLKKLRWVTLGRQYDWTNRVYLEGEENSPALPDAVRRIAEAVCAELPAAAPADSATTTRADEGVASFDAAICNFYHAVARPSDRLGGHQDDAEDDDGSPLVSLSLGLPCIFLLGGTTRAVRPLPIVLYSGDVLILRGGARRAFHGVPTVLVPPKMQPKAVRQRDRARLDLSPEQWQAVYAPWSLPEAQHARSGCALTTADFEESGDDAAVAEDCGKMTQEACAAFLARTRVNFSIRASGTRPAR
eukprot:TRINITY_DN124495_c0_g1_i1.p1 TRINITY_DN124495_c0_g1~~TRINITY_DN124495_c0_g1_i1.p1  ORF type:complete len:422 (-),score=77.56 TRINITY_DN124495_c0_g1_i1:82-1314(-)